MLAGQPNQPPWPPSRYMATLSKFSVLIAYSTPPDQVSFAFDNRHPSRHTDVGIMSLLAFSDIGVGDQIAKTVGFDHKSDLGRGVLLENGSDRVNVCLVLGKTIVCDGVLSVGSKGGTIAIGQIIDYKRTDDLGTCASGILLLNVGEIGIHGRYFGRGVTDIVSIIRFYASLIRLTAKRRFQSLQQHWP